MTVGSVPYVMQVDFLAGEYGGNAKSHRHQRVQDMLAHKARGADVVFDQFYPEDLKGRLLNGGGEWTCERGDREYSALF